MTTEELTNLHEILNWIIRTCSSLAVIAFILMLIAMTVLFAIYMIETGDNIIDWLEDKYSNWRERKKRIHEQKSNKSQRYNRNAKVK